MAQKTTLKKFESVYPKLEAALLDHAKSYKLPQEQLDWYKKVRSTFIFNAPNDILVLTNACLLELERQSPRRQM